MPGGPGERERLDIDLLDPENPFEIDDGNRVHLMKHLPEDDQGRPVAVGPEDVLDAYIYGDPAFYPANEYGAADWLMVGIGSRAGDLCPHRAAEQRGS